MSELYYQDVEVGAGLPPLSKLPTTKQLVMWAAGSGDFNPIHYDKDLALARGLPGVVVPGQLVGCFLGQLVTDWMGDLGSLAKLSLSYKGMMLPDEALRCRGTVTKKYTEGETHLAVVNIWAENPRGEKTVTGSAVVKLPSRE